MKIKTLIIFLLIFGCIGYFREFFFVNLNNIMFQKYYNHTDLPIPAVMEPFNAFSYKTLYYSKYIYSALWVVIFFGMYLYLIGIIRFPNETPIVSLSKFRVIFSTIVGAWIVYLVSGFMLNDQGNSYRSLELLSGLAPPSGYSYGHYSDSPPGLSCDHDYILAMERARRENKPLLVDFTGKACVNCRKMEEQVWPKVQGLLQSEFVIVSLFVDDKQELPSDLKEVYKTKWSGVEKEIETYGDMWSAFEIETFNSNSQPLYVIIDPMTIGEEELMNQPLAGMVSEEEFKYWLNEGIRFYNLK